jgi:hypothetical protein
VGVSLPLLGSVWLTTLPLHAHFGLEVIHVGEAEGESWIAH